MQRFVVPLFPDNIFDEYIIFKGNNVVWESFPSGIVSAQRDSMLIIDKGVVMGGIKNLSARGKGYKMFLQPVKFGGSSNLIIAGLLTDERYSKETKQLQMHMLMLLTTLVIIIIVAFPWLKLYQMGSKDMLTIGDGIGSVVVAILLCSLFFFVFFKYNVLLRADHTDDAKENLANSISSTFLKEVNTAYYALASLDSLISRDKSLQKDIRNIQNLTANKGNFYKKESDSISLRTKLKLNSITIPINTNETFWIEGSGWEIYNWTSRNQNAPHNNLGARAYFNRINNASAYQLSGNISQPYFLDQIVSWTRGGFTSVISKRSQLQKQTDSVVTAMSFTVKSLQKTILTAGYQFAIINTDGLVIYHTDPSKNLNENLKAEFSEKDELLNSLESGITKTFVTNYGGKQYEIRCQKLANLPYFIVMFDDRTYKEARDIKVYSFTIAMMLCFFSFLALQLILTFLTSSKKKVSRKQRFDISWLSPKISSLEVYNQSTVINIAIILILIIGYQFSSFLQFFFFLLYAVSLSGLFLNLIFLKKYLAEGSSKYLYKRNASATIAVLLLLSNMTSMFIFSFREYLGCLAFQLATTFCAYLFFQKSERLLLYVSKANSKLFEIKWTFTRSFTMMTLTRLIIASGIPILFFYISIYNYEQNLSIRYRQIQFATKILQKFPRLNQSKIESLNKSSNPYTGIFTDKIWIKDVHYAKILPQEKEYDFSEKLTLSFFKLFRVYESDHANGSEDLFYMHSTDGKIAFNHLLRDAFKNSGTKTFIKLPAAPGYLELSSAGLNYKTPLLFLSLKGTLFWILFLIGLYTLYHTLHNVIKKVFAQNLPNTIAWEIIDNELLTNSTLNNLLFIIGLPGSGKMEYVRDAIESNAIKLSTGEGLRYDKKNPEQNNVYVVDLIVMPENNNNSEDLALWNTVQKEASNDRYKLLIINHFEYNLKDQETNNSKLNFLERLMLEAKARIMILSTVHPVTFLDSLNINESNGLLSDNHKHDLERWHVLLGHFRILIKPLQNTLSMKQSNDWEELIINETTYTHFLNKLQHPVISAVRSAAHNPSDIDCVSIAFKIHAASHYFYMYIWQSLTREEKFILYDLAQEGLVNAFDEYNLSMLISKGAIIQNNGRLKLFNSGFQDFILTAIGTSEAMKIRNEIKDNGNWSSLKGPLQLIIIAILVFLFASQQETYSKILTYAAALGAGIPTVLKLFSLFNKNEIPKA